MDYNFVLYLTPKPQRKRKRNTTPDEWKKICEENYKQDMEKKDQEIEPVHEVEFNNDHVLDYNSGYAVDKNDWEDLEKWEIENTEKTSAKKNNVSKNIDISAIISPKNTVSPLEQITEQPVAEQVEEITDQMENLNI